jgi:hypothetical protein
MEALEGENRDLRRRVRQLEGQISARTGPPGTATAEARLREVEEHNRVLERRLADLERRRPPPDPSGL